MKTLIFLLLMTFFTVSCTKVPELVPAQVGYISTNSLKKLSESQGMSSIRLQALQETAASLGTQGALAWRSEHIDNALQRQARYLDRVFDFNQLMLRYNVLPPVLVQSDYPLNLARDDVIRLADKTYQIISPARFVTAPPTWRDYLWLNYKKPSVPNDTLLPRNQKEVAYWNSYIAKGWKKGLEQANQIFSANLNRLKRDYAGMILYHKLFNEHRVSAPFVSKAWLGVTGNGNKVRINDRVLRIVVHSKLKKDSQKWLPIFTP